MDRELAVQFVNSIVRAKAAAEEFDKRSAQKDAVVAELRSDLTDDVKAELRDGFSFAVYDDKGRAKQQSFDERGSEHAVDTFGATRKGYHVTPEDWKKMNRAMDRLLSITKKALSKRDGEGNPVFTSRQEIMDEVYTPLVREGVLPENFVLSDYSEVQKLLTATFRSYRARLEEDDEEAALAKAKSAADASGAGGKLDRLTGKVAVVKDQVKGAIGDRISEDNQRLVGIGIEGAKLLKSVAGASKSVGRMSDGRAEAATSRFLDAEKGKLEPDQAEALLGEERFKKLHGAEQDPNFTAADLRDWKLANGDLPTDPDVLRTAMDASKRAGRIRKMLGSAESVLGTDLSGLEDDLISFADTYLDSDELFYGKSGVDMLKTAISKGYGTYADAKSAKKLADFVGSAHFERAARDAAKRAIRAIDQEFSREASKKNQKLGAALDGLYEQYVDVGAVLEATAPDTDGVALTRALSKGFSKALAETCPTSELKAAFTAAGTAIEKSFLSKAPNAELEKALQKDPGADPFRPVVDAARAATAAGITDAFTGEIADHEDELVRQAVFGDDEDVLLALEESDEELRDYEDALVLIDEGGVAAAEQRSIETLIAQIKKDRKVISTVQKVGSGLTSLTGSSMGIAGWATEEVTDKIVGEVMGPVKAARLIMELAINVKKAADRQVLFNKFKRDLERSRVAVSSLSSPIQGFLDNKREQIAFRDIEIALQIVEIAATILGSVPEPFTMALGKTINAVNSAAQQAAKVSEMIYDEVKLRQGWRVTREAINNPSDRAKGLQALRLNTTLAMHSIAWAGMEKQPPDPVARMLLDTLGLNENTLAASGSEKKVREYLETLLDEDRQFVESAKVQATWIPSRIELGAKDWFVVTSRATRDAVPKLRKGDGASILPRLKPLAAHVDLATLDQEAQNGTIDDEVLERMIEDLRTAKAALGSYVPKASDGTTHDEMSGVADTFADLAATRLREVERIRDKNTGRRQLLSANPDVGRLDSSA